MWKNTNKRQAFLLLITFWSLTGLCLDANNTFLPKPTGTYGVGTTELFLRDSTQKNRYGFLSGYKKLYVKLWYPSDVHIPRDSCDKYIEGYDLEEIYDNFKKKGVTQEEIIRLSQLTTYSKKGLPISNDQEQFPIIFFTPGYYFGLSDLYSSIVENLASNGYIVCSIIHVHEQVSKENKNGGAYDLRKKKAALPFFQWWFVDLITFKDEVSADEQEKMTHYFLKNLKAFNKVIRRWEKSSAYVIDYLKQKQLSKESSFYSKINFNKMGTLGQSIGGALSNHLCVSIEDIACSANIDCFQFGDVINSNTSKPMLLIESDHQKKWQIGNEYIYKDFTNLDYLRVKGASHFLFCDVPYFAPAVSEDKVSDFIGNVDGISMMEVVNTTLLNFFGEHLGGQMSDCSIDYENNDSFLYNKTNKCIYLK